MARLAFAFVLFALVAVALAQNTQIVDDFVAIVPTQAATLRISNFNTETVSDSNCDPSAGGSQGQILGGCHVLSLTGNAASGCEPTGAIAGGDMFCNNAFNCAAECVLQLDGTDTSASVTGGLNVNLNNLGFAFRIFAATDIQTTFTIRVFDNSGGRSTHGGNIPQGSSDSGFVQFDLNFSDFNGDASFSDVGTIELVVPSKLDTDVVLTDWEILSNEADIFGSVFVDCDCDVQKDTDDNGIGNVVVTLTGDSSCAVSSLSATTSSAGDYSFIGLPPCTYTVSIPSTTGQFCSTSGSSQTVTLSSTSLFNVNFGIEGANTFTVPADASVFCNQGTSPSTLGSATSSSCGASGTVSFADTISNQNCDADFTITRTWSDNAGNSGNQIITVVDTNVAPTFTNADASNLNIVLDCDDCDEVGTCVVALVAVDDCSTVVVTSNDSGSANGECDPSTCSRSSNFIRTWSAVDDCGNAAATQGQVITRNCEDTVICDPISTVTVSPVSPVTVSPVSPVTVSPVSPVTVSPVSPVTVSPVSPASTVPSATDNVTNRNCRFVCDDDDSAASSLIASVFVILAALAVALF